MVAEKLKIDFGGGEVPRMKDKGYKSCDILECADYPRVDFDRNRLPFSDDSVDEAYSSHCLEHIENTRLFLNELHRVLKKGAIIRFVVPYGLHRGSCKPVHKQMISECWFDFLRNQNSYRIYGYKRWDIISDSFVFRKDSLGLIYEMEVLLTPVKE